MKVIIISNHYWPTIGGITVYINNLIQGLNESEIETEIYAPKRKKKFNFLNKITFVLCSIFAILYKTLIKREKVVINSHSANYCLFVAVVIKLFSSTRVIHTYHSPIEKKGISFKLLKYADKTVFVSNAIRDLYASVGITSNNETIIPGGIQTKKYANNKNFSDKKNILFVGRICELKGVKDILLAVSDLRVNYNLFVVGDPYSEEDRIYDDELNEIIANNNLSKNIHRFGYKTGDELIDIYKNSHVFVIPSRWEAAPMVIAEAFAAGLPVIGYDVGGIRERLAENCSIILKLKDIKGLSSALEKILSNEQSLCEMSKRATVFARENFDYKTMARKYLSIFNLNIGVK